jgi:hypothetical protein
VRERWQLRARVLQRKLEPGALPWLHVLERELDGRWHAGAPAGIQFEPHMQALDLRVALEREVV